MMDKWVRRQTDGKGGTMASFWSNGWTGRALFLCHDVLSAGRVNRCICVQEANVKQQTFVRMGATVLVGAFLIAGSGYGAEPAAEEEGGGGRLIRKEGKKPAEPVAIPEEPPLQEEGAGRLTRKETDPPSSEGARGSITPYGRIELDAIYSNRNNNPLDPGQFNGYATAAGTSSNASTTLNPRYSVFGIRADRTDGKHTLTGVVEIDFYGQTDNAGNIPPRLRLANAAYRYSYSRTSSTTLTVGMDWTPVMSLHPDLIDFSILGYNGNLWQRLPQITVRHKFTDSVEWLVTVMRFERGLSAIQPNQQSRPAFGSNCTTPSFANSNCVFNDPVQNPYYGTRLSWSGTGSMQGLMVAVSGAYRYYRSAPIPGNTTFQSGQDINSYMAGGELVIPLGRMFKFSGEIAYGQALGVEWFRYNQELNLAHGNPVRTFVGWGQLSFAPRKDWTFLAGYGWDNPRNADLAGQQINQPPGSNQQYVLNHRTYLTAVKQVWSDFYTGLEWNHLMTEWVSGNHNQGDNYMLSFWYNF